MASPSDHSTDMRLPFALAAALLAGAAALPAQNVVVSDDFEDNQFARFWNITFDPLQFWTVNEGFGALNFDGLTAPFGAFDERYIFTADVPGTLPAGFQLDIDFRWNDQSGFNPGENAQVFVVRLYDSLGVDIASFTMDDVSTVDAGNFIFDGASSATVSGVPANSSATLSLVRDANLNLSYSLDVAGRPSQAGSLGLQGGTVAKVEFYVSHTTLCGPCGPFLGQLHVEDLVLYDGPVLSGPQLSTTGLTAGATAQFDVSNATPFGVVSLAFSTTGGGPTSTAFGTASLSAPISVLDTTTADVNGSALFSVAVPAGVSGRVVWFQAADVTAGVLSNGLMETVL